MHRLNLDLLLEISFSGLFVLKIDNGIEIIPRGYKSRIYYECEGGIEISVPRITDWHHEAWQVMTNSDHEVQTFLSHPHRNNGSFFLLITLL